VKKSSRRMFLTGAAGFTLAIPFLPSLVERGAKAAPTGAPKRFVAFGTNHGGIWQSNMYPGDAALTDQQSYAGAARRRGALPLEVANGRAVISPVLSADAGVLTPALAAKLNLIRGLDVTFYLAHHRGGHLGNYAENDGNGMDGPTLPARPTIDQVMAWSDSFYPDLGTILERSLVIGNGGMSATYSSPSMQEGEIQNITPEQNSLVLFNKIFVPAPDPVEPRAPVVDKVIEDYHRLRDGNRRLSATDKRRLDDHLDRLDELQRKLNVALECSDVEVPTQASTDEWSSSFGIDPEAQRRFWGLINDVVVAAFACDTTRVVTCLVGDTFSSFAGDWHQDVAHQTPTQAAAEQLLADGNQRFFEDVFLDLAAKLDGLQDGEGNSVLDATLMQWTQECGVSTHDPIEMAVVTAGSADGFFATGQYVDYRNLNKPAHVAQAEYVINSHIGLVYNQYLGNVLQGMGLDASEYESGAYGGYGEVKISTENWYAGYDQYDAELDSMGDLLPFLRA
jgi:hypothetical protein